LTFFGTAVVLGFNTGRPRIAAVAETCDLPFVFFFMVTNQ